MKHWKSIIQRGLKGGGFGVTQNQELQLSPFLPWDYCRSMASGRDSWSDDLLIALDHDRVFGSYEIRANQSGVLITADCILPSHIRWAAHWSGHRWRTIYHRHAAGLFITGAEEGNPRTGIHPGMKASYDDCNADYEAQAEEERGRNSGSPPKARVVEEPGNSGGPNDEPERGRRLPLVIIPQVRPEPKTSAAHFHTVRSHARLLRFPLWDGGAVLSAIARVAGN